MTSRSVSRSRLIHASPEAIFAIVSSPAGHVRIDGSGSLRDSIEGPDHLTLGDKFRMDMKMGVPYKMWSTVVEFEQDRLIAWAHFGKHRWRFELEPVGDSTMVTHTFDWSTARSPKFIELMGYPKKHPANLEATLERLAAVVEGDSVEGDSVEA
ncbi:MAG: SRPBCC family protein [Acidimicrobiales bacterium]